MSREEVRQQVLNLMNEKDKIENEIKELTNVLMHNGVGMTEPLVDEEGFPKNSINIHQVRHARHRIICLQNDHKHLMKQIENGLQGYYNATSSECNQSVSMETTPIEIATYKTPFAKVTFVSDNSPAYYAGLNVNDEIVEFGSVNVNNFKNINDIATVVQHSEGNPLNVRIKRGERFVNVQLTPKKWIGRGLLGCNIICL
ncbi:26S proteasome non-ATPase regulatory subunit 9 [Diorhabda carinulata]|uniref:26S proteasome non-ATPase regulatory subunit 9 n=1 Tax=Diorhabda sublineata TaxID=1163346 RepID=UPI0024E159AB|nr:26S proteasome non-ATPase regulatory subunit 9 [Diorhabda sublineata]XP_057667815.1 26S proteasome non-ATPase regulatory subunit 9 [Diorhabda carinulata]